MEQSDNQPTTIGKQVTMMDAPCAEGRVISIREVRRQKGPNAVSNGFITYLYSAPQKYFVWHLLRQRCNFFLSQFQDDYQQFSPTHLSKPNSLRPCHNRIVKYNQPTTIGKQVTMMDAPCAEGRVFSILEVRRQKDRVKGPNPVSNGFITYLYSAPQKYFLCGTYYDSVAIFSFLSFRMISSNSAQLTYQS